jgi:hypothetical protein
MNTKVQYINALGKRPRPDAIFSKELLAETEDSELQDIVKQAAEELCAPIALVTLVLNHVQFFKAHYGLPEDLATSRGSRRDASFCQFVVRDGKTFEIQDANNNDSLPQYFVQEYGIESYLGVPVRIGDEVAGSLCVLDTDSRNFSQKNHEQLNSLGKLVEARFNALMKRRRKVRIDLSERAAGPALAELSASFTPAQSAIRQGFEAVPAIRSFLKLSTHAQESGDVRPSVIKSTLSAATEALDACEDALYNIEAAAGDCNDCIAGLERLLTPADSMRLSELLEACQDLSRASTQQVGGAPLPILSYDPLILAPRRLAVALLSACFTDLAGEMVRHKCSKGITTQVCNLGNSVELRVSPDGLSKAVLEKLAADISERIGQDPAVKIKHSKTALKFIFNVSTP